jgi:DNA-binding protein HU-beta
MHKTELVQVLASKTGLTQKDVTDVIVAFTETITEQLSNRGEKVVLSGFGTFLVRDRAARTCADPQTGQLLHVPAQKSPAFVAGKSLKEAVKGLDK